MNRLKRGGTGAENFLSLREYCMENTSKRALQNALGIGQMLVGCFL